MNINAKQINSIDYHSMDITSALGFFGQIKNKIVAESTLTAAMGSVWTAFTAGLQAFDDAYAQAKKWAQTADLEELDSQRDAALSAFLQALKAMTASPNANKAAAAKTLTFIRDKYTLNASDEYMKETTAISQLIQEIEATPDAVTALQTTGLDDWLTDLKQKNEAFLAKMNERTEAQAGQQKGIVREKRLACEAAYRDVVKLINAMAICEVPAGYSFGTVIDLVNAEIEHYRQILARKGVSTGSSNSGTTNSGNSGTTEPGGQQGGTGSNENENDPSTGSGTNENQGGGSNQNENDPSTGSGDNPGGGGGGNFGDFN